MATLTLDEWRVWIEPVAYVSSFEFSSTVAVSKIRRKNETCVSKFLPLHYSFHVVHSLKSRWLRSGDMGAEYYEPPRPIHWPGNQWSKYTFISRPKRGGAPSCCKYRSNEMHWSIALCINNSCTRQFQWNDTSYTLDSRTCQDVYCG